MQRVSRQIHLENLLSRARDGLIAVAAIVMMLALPACASTERKFSFEFGILDPDKDVEILNWRYGNSDEPYTQASKDYLATGHIPQADNVYANFPPGDVLYVKWRVLSTDKVYEDKVDLHSSLPFDMNHKIIHFSIKGPQLYVYLIEGIHSKDQLHAPEAADCPTKLYKDNKCTELYPDHWKNF